MNNSIYALLHNESTLYVLNNLHKIPTDGNEAQELVKNLNKDFFDQYDIAFHDYKLPFYPEDPNDIDVREWIKNSPQTPELKQFVNRTIDIIEKELNLKEYYSHLDKLLEQANEKLSSSDRIKFDEHVLVAKRSYTLWFSEIQNQRVWINELRSINLSDPVQTANRINWWKVLAVDCIGGIVTGTPVGYAGASAISVVMQL